MYNIVNYPLQQHKLVDLKYCFVSKSFELEIWHTYYQPKYDFMKKNSWKKKKNSIFRRVAKLAVVKFSTCLKTLNILFWVNHLASKFSKYVINLEMILHKKFHD